MINYQIPEDEQAYVHRIGRTGRAGEEGCACSLVSADERGLLKDIEKVLKRPIPVQSIEGFEMAEVDGLEDARNTSRGNQGRGRSQGGGGGGNRPRGNGGGGGGGNRPSRGGSGGGGGSRDSRRPRTASR